MKLLLILALLLGAPSKKHKKKAPPAPPPSTDVVGEGPCKTDADCRVENGRSCCGCKTLEVKSNLLKPKRPPDCGCGYYGDKQELPKELGGGGGPCGDMPPEASTYKAVCRENTCVGVKR